MGNGKRRGQGKEEGGRRKGKDNVIHWVRKVPCYFTPSNLLFNVFKEVLPNI